MKSAGSYDPPQSPSRELPSRLSAAIFICKARVLQIQRTAWDLATGIRRFTAGDPAEFPEILAESRCPLWTEVSAAEKHLEFGKVQNLRAALRRLNRTHVPAGETFSFWKQVGQATRGRGYVPGRLLREGCLIPAVGGGLCQLSNAIYDVCLAGGLEIVERHAHSRIVPGSASSAGRDATIAWNYIDLRFRAKSAVLIEAFLDQENLIVRLRGKGPASAPSTATQKPESELNLLRGQLATGSCSTCGEAACFRHGPAHRVQEKAACVNAGRSAFVLDECWPEFRGYVEDIRVPGDLLCIPLDASRWGARRSAWTGTGWDVVCTATLETLLRSWRSRRLGRYGSARLRAQLRSSAAIASRLGRQLTPDAVHLTVSQSLLPTLWQEGHLGGRHFDVLMSRLPLKILHSLLDGEWSRHPERSTLGEFRAPDDVVGAETEALAAAERVITPHTEIASLFAERALLLEWMMPARSGKTSRDSSGDGKPFTPRESSVREPARTLIAFPGPTAARKGAYNLRTAARRMDLEILLLGSELEGEDFWDGVQVRREALSSSDWLQSVSAVVQPALVEENPRPLLAAIKAGVPVICTPACGLGDRPGVALVTYGDEDELMRAVDLATSTATSARPTTAPE